MTFYWPHKRRPRPPRPCQPRSSKREMRVVPCGRSGSSDLKAGECRVSSSNFSPRKRRGNGGRYGIHASMLQSYEIAETEVFARTKCPKKGERTRMKLLKLTQSSVPQLILAMVESSAATTVLFGHFFAPPSHNYVLSTVKLRFSEL